MTTTYRCGACKARITVYVRLVEPPVHNCTAKAGRPVLPLSPVEPKPNPAKEPK